jgi:hypothetical protein
MSVALLTERSVELFAFILYRQLFLCEYLDNLQTTESDILLTTYGDVCISTLRFCTADFADVSQIIKQFYRTASHKRDVNIIPELNIRLDAKISIGACKK